MSTILARYDQVRYEIFKWRYELVGTRKILLALAMASITGLAAQVRAPLPFTPVPITGQTIAVLLSGVILGRWYGGLSQLFYVGMGLVGVPWFTGWSSGMSHLLGPTGGYIIGFVLAALFVGHFTDRFIKFRKFFPGLLLMLVANFLLIHGPGLVWLYVWISSIKGVAPGIFTLLMMGTIPFLPGDVMKILGAAAVTKAVTPKRPYTG